MPLSDLPVEMVGRILGYCWPEDLFSMLTTCRYLHDVALPILYECPFYGNLTILEKKNRPSYLGSLGNRPLEFPSFVGAISRRPVLGTYIRYLDLSYSEALDWNSENTKRLNQRDAEVLTTRGLKISSQGSLSWHNILTSSIRRNNITESQYQQAFVVLLLSYCEGLQTLLLHDSPFIYARELGIQRVASYCGLGLSKLENVTTFKLGSGSWPIDDQPGCHCPSALLNSIFTLPRVETLILCLIQITRDANTGLGTCGTLPSVRKIIFERCNITEKTVRKILDRTPNVTSLSIEGLARNISSIFFWRDCTALAEYIAGKPLDDASSSYPARSKVLKHISITIQFYSSRSNYGLSSSSVYRDGGAYECGGNGNGDTRAEFGIKGSFGSMKHFTALETLAISPPVLLGWHVKRAQPLANILPDSLVELTLLNEMSFWTRFEWSFEVVDTLIRTFVNGKRHGALKIIRYHLFEDRLDQWITQIAALQERCDSVGIRFEPIPEKEPLKT